QVWIGTNAVIVGNITIGDDVMIAPGAYVTTDVPAHSIVIGNPAVIRHRDNATEGYINRPVAL
ncbi:MAG TPA: serine acetyltransferase, partial [Lachnospiraceae bacterium]|nr:serine acetyltransferase [Lachnospiraceae bacterium]